MIRRPPRSTLFPYDALPISSAWTNETEEKESIAWIEQFRQAMQPYVKGSYINVPDNSINDLRTDRKSTRLNSSHSQISYAVFSLNKNKATTANTLHIHLVVA